MKRREFFKVMGTLSVAGLGLDARGAIGDAKRVHRRPLGGTGVDVSVLALGGVIGMQLPPSRDHDPSTLSEQALNLGITYFATAPSLDPQLRSNDRLVKSEPMDVAYLMASPS